MSDIEFPITVKNVEFDQGGVYRPKPLFGGACGDFVSVRPCGDKYESKTFLGVLIGAVALHQGVNWYEDEGKLSIVRFGHNPMIFIPELREVFWGCGSWWSKIKDENHLRQISNDDIDNVWYVQALKAIAESQAQGAGDQT